MTAADAHAPERARIDAWLSALDDRHLADLTPSEVSRALRALSSCYVERRDKLSSGGALDGAGKRAAFALFYGAQHLFVAREVARALFGSDDGPVTRYREVLDLGCGTGSAGAAIALTTGASVITGLDLNPWAVKEANWTYSVLGLAGSARVANLKRTKITGRPGTLILAAYTVNELPTEEDREGLRQQLLDRHHHGADILVIEPIARRTNRWWPAWEDVIRSLGGRSDEWRFRTALPARQRALAKAAGLDVQELTARSLFAGHS